MNRNYVKGYESFSFVKNLSEELGKKFLDTAKETVLDAAKSLCETIEAWIGSNIDEKYVKPELCQNLMGV